MPKSSPFAKILSRLGIRGGTKTIPIGAADGKFDSYVPLLGPNNKIDGSLIDASTVTVTTVKAENVGFNSLPPTFNSAVATDVREAFNNLVNPVTVGPTTYPALALLHQNNLSDVADQDVAFNTIKIGAGVVGAVLSNKAVGGVVGVATQTETVAGTDTITDDSLGTPLPLVVPPSLLKSNYLSKTATAAQALAGAVTIPDLGGSPSAQSITNKNYVDTAVAAANQFPVNNTIWVDPVNGSNTTGARGKMGRPVQTLAQAKTLANSGDLIIVNPGTYNENDLAKSGVSWYFRPGAIVNYSSGSSTLAIFDVGASAVCKVLGYGEFWNTNTGVSDNNLVLNVGTSSQVLFEANWVQSRRTGIYVNAGAAGYAQIVIRDSLRSDDGIGDGASAAKLVSGVCNLDVGREIYSNTTVGALNGLEFGEGSSGSPSNGWQVVRCPRIWGTNNAIHFWNSSRVQVIADTCWATTGPAVKADGGMHNILTVTGELHTDHTYSAAIIVTKGRIQCNDTIVYSVHAQPLINILGTPGSASDKAYVILNNTQLWGQGFTTTAIAVNYSSEFTVRIIGHVQSDCAEPTTVIRRGGVWDYVATADV